MFPGFPRHRNHPCSRDATLDGATRAVLHNSLAPTSRRAYTSGQRCYLQFCSHYGIPPVPAHEDTIVYYIGFLKLRGASLATVRQHLAAVRFLHLTTGAPVGLHTPLVQAALRGFSTRGLPTASQQARLPITIDKLRRLKGRLGSLLPSAWDQRCVWAACTLAFYAGLRSSEFLVDGSGRGLRRRDLVMETTRCIIYLRIQKTRQHGPPHPIELQATGTSTCPLRALHLFVPDEIPPEAPLFTLESGAPLTRQKLSDLLRQCLGAGHTSHSLRIGLATSAAATGASDAQIQNLGRWSSTAFRGYVRGPRLSVHAALQAVARHGQRS